MQLIQKLVRTGMAVFNVLMCALMLCLRNREPYKSLEDFSGEKEKEKWPLPALSFVWHSHMKAVDIFLRFSSFHY